ncbi:type II secretion system F family protein [Candidatus Woesearchaeota archaeon]|nr:type II secretion system F family protein [Candidatus Woesearchaeota archaeon]
MQDTKQAVRRIVDLADEVRKARTAREGFRQRVAKTESDGKITNEQRDSLLKNMLRGETPEHWLQKYDAYIASLFGEMEQGLQLAEGFFSEAPVQLKTTKKMSKKEREKMLSELAIEKEFLDDFLVSNKKREGEKMLLKEYTLYSTNDFGKMANLFFGGLTTSALKKSPEFFAPLLTGLQRSGIKMLSKTYVSLMFLAMSAAFVFVSLFTAALYLHPVLPLQILRGVMIGFLAAISTGAVLFFYPSSAASEKDKKIKGELPFAIIHMAAVAGSGAKPISIFKTLLSTPEYPELQTEVKKIVNYVNLFGYDLSTAMKAVARTTPSQRFKDLLDGMTNTISTGGDLKEFLQAIADEALNTYKLERQKYVEVVATYSDIYTALFIAAPLLFFSTLAILQTLGGQIGGMSVGVIASIGTYLAIPILNIGFMFFVDSVKPQ